MYTQIQVCLFGGPSGYESSWKLAPKAPGDEPLYLYDGCESVDVSPGDYVFVEWYYSDVCDYLLLIQFPEDTAEFHQLTAMINAKEQHMYTAFCCDWIFDHRLVVCLWDRSYYESTPDPRPWGAEGLHVIRLDTWAIDCKERPPENLDEALAAHLEGKRFSKES